MLVFEAPETFEFAVKPGQKVKVGNRLGDVPGAVTMVGKEDHAGVQARVEVQAKSERTQTQTQMERTQMERKMGNVTKEKTE